LLPAACYSKNAPVPRLVGFPPKINPPNRRYLCPPPFSFYAPVLTLLTALFPPTQGSLFFSLLLRPTFPFPLRQPLLQPPPPLKCPSEAPTPPKLTPNLSPFAPRLCFTIFCSFLPQGNTPFFLPIHPGRGGSEQILASCHPFLPPNPFAPLTTIPFFPAICL